MTDQVAWARGIIEKSLPCECHEAYTSRGLTQPDCPRCRFADDLIDDFTMILSAMFVGFGVDLDEIEAEFGRRCDCEPLSTCVGHRLMKRFRASLSVVFTYKPGLEVNNPKEDGS